MKKNIYIILLLTFTVAGIFAQSAPKGTVKQTIQQPTPAERAQATTDKINAAVQLTPDQYTRILDVIKQYRSANPSADVKDQKDAMDKRINDILTAPQRERLKESKIITK